MSYSLPEPGSVIAGKYEVESLLGEGGMGAVYAARHTETGRRVAIKWLLPQLSRDEGAVRRLQREARSLGRIDEGNGHDNVVSVIDVGTDGKTAFIVMEHLQGEPLSARLKRQGRLTPEEVSELLVPAMRGVQAAHEAGVVHRDLKPDNIFLAKQRGRSGEVPKVLDFGISKLSTTNDTAATAMTESGSMLGTVLYMAPEQIDTTDIDAQTDVWALGVILYRALYGELPFKGETALDIALRIKSMEPQHPNELASDLPPPLAEVILRALCKDRGVRYRSVQALIDDLKPALAGEELGSRAEVGSQAAGVTAAAEDAAKTATESAQGSTAGAAAAQQGPGPAGAESTQGNVALPFQSPNTRAEDPAHGTTPYAIESTRVGPPPKQSSLPLVLGAVAIALGGLGLGAWASGGDGDGSNDEPRAGRSAARATELSSSPEPPQSKTGAAAVQAFSKPALATTQPPLAAADPLSSSAAAPAPHMDSTRAAAEAPIEQPAAAPEATEAPPAAEPEPYLPTEPALATSTVRIRSKPSGARIQINGEDVGTTPLRATLPRGKPAKLVATLDGYRTASKRLHPKRARQRVTLHLRESIHKKVSSVSRSNPVKPKPPKGEQDRFGAAFLKRQKARAAERKRKAEEQRKLRARILRGQ